MSTDRRRILSLIGERSPAPYLVIPFISRGKPSCTVSYRNPQSLIVPSPPGPLHDDAKGVNAAANFNLQYLPGEECVVLERAGIMRGETLFSLIVRPYRYNSSSRSLVYYESLEVDLTSSSPFPAAAFNLSEVFNKSPIRKVRTPPAAHESVFIRIVVDKDGMYRVTGRDLDTAGAELRGFTIHNMTLWNRGRQVPMDVHAYGGNAFTREGFIEFYGTANRVNYSGGRKDLYLDPYTDENVYFLTADSSAAVQRFAAESGAPGRAAGVIDLAGESFDQKIHVEQDRIFERLDAVQLNRNYDGQDHWFWGKISAGEMESFNFNLSFPDTTSLVPLSVTTAFQGITHNGGTGSPAPTNDHSAELLINGNRVLGTSWSGQSTNIAGSGRYAVIPQSILHHGANSLQVYNTSSAGTAVSSLAFNWVELTYRRLYTAFEDYIEFAVPPDAGPGYYRFYVGKFKSPSISIYRIAGSKVTDAAIIEHIDSLSGREYGARFELYVQSSREKFVAVSDPGKLNPVRIEVVPNVQLATRDISADYIMIASRAVDDLTTAAPAQDNPVVRLASWYNSRGTKTVVVNPIQIYNEFNYGISSPYAIRGFISHAYRNWSVPPRFLLLAGAGTWDTKTKPRRAEAIPVMMRQTYRFGAAASDNFYACIDGDDPIPDIAVGRIPAADAKEMKSVVDKIIAYGEGKSFGWQNTALFIAGEENDFHIQTDSMARSMVPPRFFVKRLYTSVKDPAGDSKYYGGTPELEKNIDDGAIFVSFLGHGGGAVWSDNGLLSNDGVPRLSNNGRFPFVASMTCFTGAFDGQVGVPLCSSLLLAENKGAVGAFASSGLGWMRNDYYMIAGLIPDLFDSSAITLSVGEKIALAKAKYFASYAAFWPQGETMVNQYNLIGDPAMRLNLPEPGSAIKLNSHIDEPGKDITGTIINGAAGGTGIIRLTDEGGYVAGEANVNVATDGSAAFSIPNTDRLNGRHIIKAYTYNASTHRSTFEEVGSGSPFVRINSISVNRTGATAHLRVIAVAASGGSTASSVRFEGGIFPAGDAPGAEPTLRLNFPLHPSSGDEYVSNYSVDADLMKPGSVVEGGVIAGFSGGGSDTSAPAKYVVAGAADVSAYPRQGVPHRNTFIEITADTLIRLEAKLFNLNSNPAHDVRVDFFEGPRRDGIFLGNTRVNFDSAAGVLVSIPVRLSMRAHEIYVYSVFDSLSEGFDLDPSNDYAFETVDVNFAAAGDDGVAEIDGGATIAGGKPGEIFRVDTLQPILFHQPSLRFAHDSAGRAHFYGINTLSASAPTGYSLALAIESADSETISGMNALHIYQYDPRSRTFNVAGGRNGGGGVSASVSVPGIFAAAYSTDNSGPRLSLSAGDQFFTNGDYVPPDPRFSVVIQDPEGVDLRKGNIRVELDGRSVDASCISLPDTVYDPASVAASIIAPAKDGSHEIVISASDANGNAAEPIKAGFVVRSDFTLRVFGSYPNPFTNKTFIGFEVTAGASIESVVIRIYTVSGRLVKTIRYPGTNPSETIGLLQGGTGSPTSVGYHEAWWDGTDNAGNSVANGVYFYKVSVSSGGKTIDQTGKMARLR